MEFEALLLGIEPLTVAVIGAGALIAAPVVSLATGQDLSEAARTAAKTGINWAHEGFEKTQAFLAETSESFQDLVAEAQAERANTQSNSEAPQEVMIQ